MFVRWQRREGFTVNFATHPCINYMPDAGASPITNLNLQSSILDTTTVIPCSDVTLTFSPCFANEVMMACDQLSINHFQRNESHTQFTGSGLDYFFIYADIHMANVQLNHEGLTKLLALFNHFNSKWEIKPFPPELISELTRIQQMQSIADFSTFNHDVEAAIVEPFTKLRPDYEEIADIFAYQPLSHVHRQYLLEGDNPNKPQQHGHYTAIRYAVLRQCSIRALELLLWYKAKPFAGNILNGSGRHGLSAFELAIAFKQYAKADLIVRENSKLLTQANPRQISNTRVEYRNGEVYSWFLFADYNHIKTRLTPISRLTEDELKDVFELYKTMFSSKHSEDKLIIEFKNEFSQNRLIDIVYHQDKIIGFNLHEIVKPPAAGFSRHLFVYCAYAAIKPEFRNTGLMQILSFRLAYALKQLDKYLVVGLFYSAIHYNSYRLAKFQHWPKYQSRYTTELAKSLLDIIMPDGYRYVHQGLKTYTEEEIAVMSVSKPREAHLDERMYQEELLANDNNETSSNYVRSVPVMFIVNDENTQFMENHAQAIGFDFSDHNRKYSAALMAFIKHNEIKIKDANAFHGSLHTTPVEMVALANCVNPLRQKL